MTNDVNLSRFAYPRRDRLLWLARSGRGVADLATTFPLLFLALAMGYGPRARREKAVWLANSGRPLRDVAGAIGLPLALRRIAP